jgi:hypothetical protein
MADRTLTATEPATLTQSESMPGSSRLSTILHVQWALAIACAYLVIFGRESGDPHGVGPLVVVGFLATNLVVGRLRPGVAERPTFGIVLALLDALLVVASLYVAGQLSVELVLLCEGILVMAIAGLGIGPIALATLALSGAYLTLVWFTGGTTLWRSSVLLRVPLLFTVAIVYAWLVDIGSRGAAARQSAEAHPTDALLEEVAVQWQAIERCRAALRAGDLADAETALREVAAQSQAIRMHAGALR